MFFGQEKLFQGREKAATSAARRRFAQGQLKILEKKHG